MRVLLDDQCVCEHADSLTEALRAASERAEELGRLILEVRADGEHLPSKSLEVPDEHADPIAELAVVSAEPAAFGLNMLDEAAVAIAEALKLQVSAADLMEKGDAQKCFEQLSAALTVWDMVQQAIAQTRQFAPPPTSGLDQRVEEQITGLRDQLLSVRTTIEAQDWATLSDTLRYDLAELGQDWIQLLREWAHDLPRQSR